MSRRERRNVPVVDYWKLYAACEELQEVEDKDVTVGAGVSADEREARMSLGAKAKKLDLDQQINLVQEENTALQQERDLCLLREIRHKN